MIEIPQVFMLGGRFLNMRTKEKHQHSMDHLLLHIKFDGGGGSY